MSRRFATHTPLGQALLRSRLDTVNELAMLSGVNARTISDYLAGRVRILPAHLGPLCDTLNEYGAETTEAELDVAFKQ